MRYSGCPPRYHGTVPSEAEREQYREYVRIWAGNGPLLEAVRDDDIREADTPSSIRMFESAFRLALRDLPARDSSGLVAWQDEMARWRRRG